MKERLKIEGCDAWIAPVATVCDSRETMRGQQMCHECDAALVVAVVYDYHRGSGDPRFRSTRWVSDVCSHECGLAAVIKQRLIESA